ncbi:Acetylcholinesterase, partial [Paragonimus heterotremus]
FASACGCKTPSIDREASLKCLQSLDPITLVYNLDVINQVIAKRRLLKLLKEFNVPQRNSEAEALNWARSSRLYFDVPLQPVVDGYLLPKHPQVMLSSTYQINLKQAPEVLVGTNRNEGMYFIAYGLNLKNTQFFYPDGRVELPHSLELAGQRRPVEPNGNLADFHRITAAQILGEEQLIRGISQLPALFYGLPVSTNFSEGYSDPDEQQLNGDEILKRLDEMGGDLDFICPLLDYADRIARMDNAKVYMYNFQRRTSEVTTPPWTGVMHGYEIEYVFGMPRSEKFQKRFYRFNNEERKISDNIMKMWTNFAKRGDPNINDDGSTVPVTWPLYKATPKRNSSRSDYLILDTEFKQATGLRVNECRFWLHVIPELISVSSRADEHCGQGNSGTSVGSFYFARAFIVVGFLTFFCNIHHRI